MKRAALVLALGLSTSSTGCMSTHGHHDSALPALVAAGALTVGVILLAGAADGSSDECDTMPGAGCFSPSPGTGLPTDDL